ncbi:endonuclease/exonuclease/phosphatase family protein [Bremerella sp. JC817]|uniref:endonuclease/exonuclease/phosphatase family protein n=1 Tax=Bremerella sp. JC817 TaxID=3231756 RepID=UPI003459E8E6
MMNDAPPASFWKDAILRRGWIYSTLVIVLLAAATLVTGFAREHWIADILANLRVQQQLAALLLVLICGAYRHWLWMLVPLACLMIHLPWFLPASPRPGVSANFPMITVACCNVKSSNANYQQAIDSVLEKDPDVFIMLEITAHWADEIRQATESDYPHRIVRPSDKGNFGIGLYSKHPIEQSDVFQLNEAIHSIEAVVKVEERTYRVIGTHPLPPIGKKNARSRNEHLERLAERIRQPQLEMGDHSTIVIGDFNLTPWSPYYRDFELASGLYRDRRGIELTPTWYVLPTFPFGLALDHSFSSGDLSPGYVHVGDSIGSDHRSISTLYWGNRPGVKD